MYKRAEELGLKIGRMEKGKLNKITDVPGVKVGHATIKNEINKTGVTIILPHEENIFQSKVVASSYVLNGFGKTAGLIQVSELGNIETPIALTSTLNVGLVMDALVEYTLNNAKEEITSVNAVVAECNDGRINSPFNRAVKKEHVFSAIENACEDFSEGDVGAGTGMICYGLKGGIGSASRMLPIGKGYTLGVLVQTNFGSLGDLTICGKNVGESIKNESKNNEEKGSVIVVVATDLPLTSRQLTRVIKRVSVGLARTGSFIGHGSGEVFLGFSTSNRIEMNEKDDIVSMSLLNESKMNTVFRAAAEATEEAVLNSMLMASPTTERNGNPVRSLNEFIHLL
ncbi:MAG: P1 family peptidase [Ruminococcaceae bacterium]|nr:P1 family peptidase [Oscillospiraceae bacterium]